MEGSLTNEDTKKGERLENGEEAILGEQIPYVMTEEEFCCYIKGRLPKWIEEVEKLSTDQEHGKE